MGKKMTIEEASLYFQISKEAIHNRVRRGSLKALYENNIKYVIVEKTAAKQSQQKKEPQATPYEEKYNIFLEQHTKELQEKLKSYEQEIKELREQKERMLIEERERIEQVYKEKDEHLKNILSAISTKFLLDVKPMHNKAEKEEHFEVEIEEKKNNNDGKIGLKKYLKKQNYSDKKRKKILKKVRKLQKNDSRFTKKDTKIFIDTLQHSYDDIF